MRQSRVVLLSAAAGLGLSLALFCIVAGRSNPTSAAPRSDYDASDPLGAFYVPMYQTIYCTLNTTATRDYLGDNHSFNRAANLANYNNLNLAHGDVPTDPIQVLPDEDYFQLANATPGHTYEIVASPDGAGNYNLGIVVYNASYTPIITDSDPLDGNSASVTLDADDVGPYYFKVFQISAYCTGGTYDLDVDVSSPPGSDPYEPNNTRGTAYVFPVVTSASATDANFVPSDTDQDWFAFYVKSGRSYRASTSNLVGVDTYVEVFDEDGDRVADDNDGGGGFASRAEWEASYDGYYYIKVTNKVDTSQGDDTYNLTVQQVNVTATATPRPASPNPDADRCDKTELGNHDFDHACVISADVAEQFNFVPPPFGGTDNDFFKIWVKPGLLYDCSTSNLSAGVDPNMILYDHNRNAIGGNDDIEPGNFNSRLAYYATYDGWMYVLVGTGDRTPTRVSDSDYTLRCAVQVPGQATATPSNGPGPTDTPKPTAGPGPQTRTPAPPSATPTPFEELTVRTLTTPTPVPATTPAPRFIPIRLLVYYDGNDDQQPGAGEGISGISAQAYEVATNQLLAQGFTDERGNLEFTVAAQGPVRVSVPFFGFRQLVAGQGASIYLRVPPQPVLRGMP